MIRRRILADDHSGFSLSAQVRETMGMPKARREEPARSIGRLLTITWFIVVVGACCCTGLVVVAYNYLFEGNIDPLIMIAILGPMGVLVGFLLWKMLRRILHSINVLGTGLHQVAMGDFETRLDARVNDEATRIMYEDFNRMVESLKANELLSQSFVSDFSHEFKTPINSINGFSLLLLDDLEGRAHLSTEERAAYLRIIANESKRLSNLSSNTLLLNRLDSKAILEASDTFQLDEQVRDCLLLLQEEWMKKDLKLDLSLEDIEIRGNREMLKEVWINLIGNAVKFTPEGGSIGVSLTEENGLICAIVRDTGIGMDEQTLAHVFDRYYQGDPSHATRGHGLGLAIAKRIVELSGGYIKAESYPGKGSKFIVFLPVRKI